MEPGGKVVAVLVVASCFDPPHSTAGGGGEEGGCRPETPFVFDASFMCRPSESVGFVTRAFGAVGAR